MTRTRLAPALVALALLAPSGASAFLPSPNADVEVAGPDSWSPPLSRELESGVDGDLVLDAFQARHGGAWRMIRNEAVGTPQALYGSGLPLAADGSIGDAGEAEALARTFAAENADLLGLEGVDLAVGETVHGHGKWAVNFFQSAGGIRVWGSNVTFVFHESGRLYAILNTSYPSAAVSTTPSFPRESAVLEAKEGLLFSASRDREEGTSLAILPVPGADGVALRLAWRVDLSMAEPFGLWSTYVDAADGTVLWRRNNYENFSVDGTVTGIAPDFNVCDGEFNRAFRNMRVKEIGINNAVPTDTASGSYSITVADTLPKSFAIQLIGRAPANWIQVVYVNGPEAADTASASAGQTLDWFWDDSNSRRDERAAWVHGNRAHDFIKGIDPTFTGLDYQVVLAVGNGPGQANCPGNALWDGTNAHFCEAGGPYNNTGEIGDVVYHEYGHGASQFVYAGFGMTGAMSEGNSDVLANLINEDPIIGDGFTSCGIGIRNSNNALTLADTTTHAQAHIRGQIIAGFWWELRGRMIEAHDDLMQKSPDNQGKFLTYELWHWDRRLLKPFNETAMVLGAFIADDDDGNLSNGTPNYPSLCAIATAKGFSCPSITQGVAIAHDALPSTTDTLSARVVSADVTSLSGGVDPASVTLHYRVNGGSFANAGMSSGGGSTYTAQIPAQSLSALVEYYVSALDSTGQRGLSPRAAEDATPDTSDVATPANYPAYHAYDVCVVYDACESVGSWVPHAPGSTSVGGIWQNGSPSATSSQPGYDMTPNPGTNCFVTGAASGNVNNGFDILLSPVWDLSAYDSVRVKLRRWFVNDLDSPVGQFRHDYYFIDVSNDSGQTWTNVETTNEGVESWQEREFDLSALFGDAGNVRFRFTVQDTGGITSVEALVDEVRIVGKLPLATAVEDLVPGPGAVPARFALHANEPNPFNPSTLIRFDLAQPTRVDLAIYNLSGQRVRTLAQGALPAGTHRAFWNGRNDRGEEVASGPYIYRLESPRFSGSRKMLLVK